MGTYYGSYAGAGKYWRTYVTTTVTGNNTSCSVELEVGVNHKVIPTSVASVWNKKHDLGNLKIEGSIVASWSKGSLSGTEQSNISKSFALKTVTKTYIKDCDAQTFTVTGYNTHSSSGGSSELAGTSNVPTTLGSCFFLVPARSKFTITFDRNGGSGGEVSLHCSHCGENHKSYGYNSSVVTTTEPTKVGYRFRGWYTARSGGEKVTTVTANAARTYYAQWTPIIYYVRYNKNASDAVGQMSMVMHTYDRSFNLKKCLFSRPGYRFVGWSDDPDSLVVKYLDEQSVSNLCAVYEETVDLYAVWEPYVPNTYVRFNNKWVRINKIVIKNKTDWSYVQKVFVKQNGLWVQLE